MNSPLRLIPLGGLGEIGMNCMAIEHDGEILVLDCGITFDDRALGVDVIHPDFTYLKENVDRVRAIVLTHGHEDHLGAVTHLLRDVSRPVYGPPYALAMLRHRFEEAQRAGAFDVPEMTEMRPGDRFDVGPFDIESFRVTHSMPDCLGLILRTPQGVVVHSGDFKIEEEPTDGEHFDLARLGEVAREEGVRLLLSDSTNALAEGSSGEEAAVAEHLLELVKDAPGRVVVSLFASNLHRLRALTKVAKATGRKLCLLGRSLETHARLGEEQGYARGLAEVRIDRSHARSVPRDSLLVLATGTQGEAPAALGRLARDEHPDLSLSAGDRVIHSARVIPGNETPIFDMLNALERRGIEVIWRATDAGIHVSGHAHRGEQRRLIELCAPEAFLPVHGTFMHMRHHAALAREAGVKSTVVVENGSIVELDEDGLHVRGEVTHGRVHLSRGRPVAERAIQDRALLAELGVAFLTFVVDDRGRPLGQGEILTRGLVDEDANQSLLDEAVDRVFDHLERKRWHEDRPEEGQIEDEARRAMKRFFSQRLGARPLCYATAHRAAR